MMYKEIGEIFDFITETNLTEEYFYNHQGHYPVYSGQTANEGIVAQVDTYNEESPCVTFTTYGSAGKLYYREGKYTIGRNCMGLRIKDEYKEDISLKWFAFHFQNLFYKLRIGDPKGQKSLNKMLLERVTIEIPKLTVQERQLNKYNQLYRIKIAIGEVLCILSNLLGRVYKPYRGAWEIEKLQNIFHIEGGNSGLTEDFVYYNQPSNEQEKLSILSGATLKANLMGYISRNAKPNGRNLKIFSAPEILVVRKGIAGQMTYISRGEFTTNDDAYVLAPKENWKAKVNLLWFIHEYQDLFFNLVTSKSDNATFNKAYALRQIVKIPDIEFQNMLAKKIQAIESILANLEKFERKFDELLKYTIAGLND